MNFLSRIFSGTSETVPPLQFSPEAIEEVRTHLAKRPSSAFQIRIERKNKHSNVQVGYDQRKNVKTVHSYPIVVEMSEIDEICLEGARIDWDALNREFRIHPDVDLDIEYGTILNRFKIKINRNLFKDDQPRIYQNADGLPDWFPIQIRKLEFSKVEIRERIWLLDLTERHEIEEILKIEKEIADEILDYFSEFPIRRD
ncbi:hypothetical protein EHQ76_05730 [Leptospira barantonii]|uniref:Uncharacterized protein n=1 Tax=Leptospira barantonii TaxID=2023184 RepID=A0A5F2BLE1_9LEPT|nr:hypothetical protein [Leptospira barantonii]TGM06393.1 hypothetical protein EHQ76_05730 [Leptospira barantonii]